MPSGSEKEVAASGRDISVAADAELGDKSGAEDQLDEETMPSGGDKEVAACGDDISVAADAKLDDDCGAVDAQLGEETMAVGSDAAVAAGGDETARRQTRARRFAERAKQISRGLQAGEANGDENSGATGASGDQNSGAAGAMLDENGDNSMGDDEAKQKHERKEARRKTRARRFVECAKEIGQRLQAEAKDSLPGHISVKYEPVCPPAVDGVKDWSRCSHKVCRSRYSMSFSNFEAET